MARKNLRGESASRPDFEIEPDDIHQLPNRRHELFARFMAEGETQIKAYELAGYTPNTSASSIMAAKPEIKARVAVLKKAHEEREMNFRLKQQQLARLDPTDESGEQKQLVEWTVQRVLEALSENARLAQIAGEFGAAHKSLELIGKALGMFDKPKENDSGKPPQPAVSLTFVGQVLEGAAGVGGHGDPQEDNALAPRV